MRVHEIVPNYGRFSVARQASSTGASRTACSSASWCTRARARRSPRARARNAFRARPSRDSSSSARRAVRQRVYGRSGQARGEQRDRPQPWIVAATVRRRSRRRRTIDHPQRRACDDRGAMPPEFYFPSCTMEFWRPIALNPANASRGGHFGVVARAKPAVDVQQAGVEMKTIAGNHSAPRIPTRAPRSPPRSFCCTSRSSDPSVLRPAPSSPPSAPPRLLLRKRGEPAQPARASVRERKIPRFASGAPAPAKPPGDARWPRASSSRSRVAPWDCSCVQLLVMTPIESLGAGSISWNRPMLKPIATAPCRRSPSPNRWRPAGASGPRRPGRRPTRCLARGARGKAADTGELGRTLGQERPAGAGDGPVDRAAVGAAPPLRSFANLTEC